MRNWVGAWEFRSSELVNASFDENTGYLAFARVEGEYTTNVAIEAAPSIDPTAVYVFGLCTCDEGLCGDGNSAYTASRSVGTINDETSSKFEVISYIAVVANESGTYKIVDTIPVDYPAGDFTLTRLDTRVSQKSVNPSTPKIPSLNSVMVPMSYSVLL